MSRVTLSSRLKFVSLAFNSSQELMQYMMIVRYNGLEEIHQLYQTIR